MTSIPIVDIFAGPGGLGEGFSSVFRPDGEPAFDVRLSIEKDETAHRTLSLRAFFRAFGAKQAPDAYYDYIRGDLSRDQLFGDPRFAAEAEFAKTEARLATLGETPTATIDKWIRQAVGDSATWALVGGPPCQAYSIAGRSRRRPVDAKAFEKDEKHFLYREYLRIIRQFQPPVFVMENVKGLLTSTHGGSSMFARILEDLSRPASGLEYEIRSFSVPSSNKQLRPEDFVLETERYGIPQTRHRVILLGVRSDRAMFEHMPIQVRDPHCSLAQALAGLPSVRSRLSQEEDSHDAWLSALAETKTKMTGCPREVRTAVLDRMVAAVEKAERVCSIGGRFVPRARGRPPTLPPFLAGWLLDEKLGGACQHETRRHMRSDLHRYLFAACFADAFGHTPKLPHFPAALLPDHRNVTEDVVPFLDRFRVQTSTLPCTTVVSHIAKDGHYYIHPDPAQCRSLTVREAARLQTFPDNYFFEGSRTEQYTQVGNAVPPLLAYQLGNVVLDLLQRSITQDRDQHGQRAAQQPALMEAA